jgi:predicted helicase
VPGKDQKSISIHDILDQFRKEALSNRELGDKFERLICRYLELDPLYADRFSNVWMWNEWPQKGNIGDIGVDLVAEERATGEICAIQCKFYLPDHYLDKGDIDSFFTTLGKKQFSSGIIVSTTDKWSSNAEHALSNQSKPISRLRVQDLDNSPVDWSGFSLKKPQELGLRKKKALREHQKTALKNIVSGLKEADRGKLIMACGTGKTFTSLKIAEEMAPEGHVLFLVPSLSLLSQSLREWTAEAENPIHAIVVCSDASIVKKSSKTADDTSDITTHDLAFPATTSARNITRYYEALQAKAKKKKSGAQMTVVFSTYHSIKAVSEAQKKGFPDFDLIICDEAHRTTGVTLADEDESHFVKIHDPTFIKGAKRLYMTATPRIYNDDTKSRAREADAELCSMDDPELFGEELHRLGFGEAVGAGLLSDYKVLVLAVDEKYVSKTFQRQIANSENELNLEDAVKITGCWNGLAKRLDRTTAKETDFQGDTSPMTKAVAFSRSIKGSKAFVQQFHALIESYKADHPNEENLLNCELDHVDGTYDALKRNALLDWLKAPSGPMNCRILSNARCLSEGVDVPALDSVIFLNPRNSVVDVVQSVGRVMRKSPGKQYGYIILPIGIPADLEPEEALKDNQKYKVVWQVLQALRAHDDRFNATVNKIELNKKPPKQIEIIGVGGAGPEEDPNTGQEKGKVREIQTTFHFPHLEEWKDAIFARIVLKCGSRRYWEDWAKDVAKIAQRHTDRITLLLEQGEDKHAKAFERFLKGLHQNINPAISREEAIEMLSQHLITRPVFDALFENYTFSKNNPVSKAMQSMLDALEDQALEKETAALEKFYASVRQRAEGIDNAEGKQRVVIELYDKFFRAAFPKMVERLGIVYTPVEVVDFMVRSVEDILQHEFNTSVSAPDVHIIDPFSGTGTFMVRLLQSGLIQPKDLNRKYTQELHANEIVLLAYYIAAINIEETFHTLQRKAAPETTFRKGKPKTSDTYTPFEGIVLTDTFQLTETKGELDEKMFPENNQRVTRQKNAPIRVVIANPPYSVNDNPVPYPALDARIEATYAARSTATLKNSLYDSYIRAIRWASDRIGDNGIVAFVTNGSFIDSNVCDGLRASLTEEFSKLYIFNLRGNARTSGEQRRMEKDNVFGQGTRTPVAISLLIKNPAQSPPAEILYHDIGDYLTREEKLGILRQLQSLNGLHRREARRWKKLHPNSSHDWINQRDPAFETFIPLGAKKSDERAVFVSYSNGVKTNRDFWVYSFSRSSLNAHVSEALSSYREKLTTLTKTRDLPGATFQTDLKELLQNNREASLWSTTLLNRLNRMERIELNDSAERISIYRPFQKLYHYFDKQLNDRPGQHSKIFPLPQSTNLTFSVTGVGEANAFSVLITDTLPNLHYVAGGQCFPLCLYEKVTPENGELDLGKDEGEGEIIDGYRRRSGISDSILATFRSTYGEDVSKEDIFYYVYGILHSPEYRERFASDLKKMLPRIPLTKERADYEAFTKAGRDLAHWHLNYETIEPYDVKETTDELGLDPWKLYEVRKMAFPKTNKQVDKTRILYNSHITLSGIPEEAYDYIVNGKPALEWIMERYQVTVDKASGIKNDPNDWCREHDNPRYIIDLIKRVVRVSLETNMIVDSLPPLNVISE